MSTHNFNLRGIEPCLMIALKQKASQQNISVNVLILKIIKSAVGHNRGITRPVYNDLDKLAGTWSNNQANAFTKHTEPLEDIDGDL